MKLFITIIITIVTTVTAYDACVYECGESQCFGGSSSCSNNNGVISGYHACCTDGTVVSCGWPISPDSCSCQQPQVCPGLSLPDSYIIKKTYTGNNCDNTGTLIDTTYINKNNLCQTGSISHGPSGHNSYRYVPWVNIYNSIIYFYSSSDCTGSVLTSIATYCFENNPNSFTFEDWYGNPTPIPTQSPTLPTKSPTKSPTQSPTLPTKSPTKSPTQSPTTSSPTKSPTTSSPTKSPTTSSPTITYLNRSIPVSSDNTVTFVIIGVVSFFGFIGMYYCCSSSQDNQENLFNV